MRVDAALARCTSERIVEALVSALLGLRNATALGGQPTMAGLWSASEGDTFGKLGAAAVLAWMGASSWR